MRHVRQDSDEHVRRWFFDGEFDLIAWYQHDGALLGFQLCYDKPDSEKALTWLATRGVTHHAVDSGEESPWFNRTPMLVALEGRSGMGQLLAHFTTAHTGVPPELAQAVEGKIREYGRL